MAEKLSKALRPASWRGVPFQVDSTDMGAGRRTQLHEYPQRDKPWVEDLGRAARDVSFDAYVVGPDYVAQANKLIGALEEAGPGTLVHPWFGTLNVNIKDVARVSFNSALGYARFSLSFVEAGELSFPVAGNSTVSQSRIAATNIENAAIDDFAGTYDVNGFQDFVAEQAADDLTNSFAAVSGTATTGAVPGLDVFGYASRGPSALQTSLAQLYTPLALGQSIASYLNVSGYSGGVNLGTGFGASGWVGLGQSLLSLYTQYGLRVPAAPAVYTRSRQQAYTNTVAINALMRQVLVAQAVGVSSLADARVYDDTIGLRNNLTQVLDAEALNASDATFTALTDARGTVWRDLTERSRSGARLTSRTPPETTPALVLAYDLYDDATRNAEIVARNGVRHPGFVPPRPLLVLTR